jgi:4-amino-4-deoxy-L-arabinose transferase-like glycosyltransferase
MILHGPAGELQQQLMLGAHLFRAGLVITGLYLAVLGVLLPDDPNRMAGGGTAKRGAYTMAILLAVVCVAAILRIYRLNYGIWLDEMLTYVNYMPLSVGRIFTTFDDANNHMLYTMLAKLSFDLFGESTWALRLPAVLFGVGSIPALYYFARQVSSEKEALFSAALFAFSYHHVWFSQNARGYTALLFFALLSSGFLLQALRRNSTRYWLLYALSASLGVLTHLTMGFVIVAHFLVYITSLVTGRAGAGAEKWSGLLVGFVIGGMLSYLAYALVLPQMFGGGLASGAQGTVAEWTNPVWMVLEVVRGMQISFTSGIVALLACLVFAIGVIDFLRKAPVLPVLLFVPATLGFIVMLSIGYTLFPRFFFFAMGFAVIVVVRGAMLTGASVGWLLRLPAAKSTWPGTAICTGLVMVSLLSVPFAYGPKQDYVGALELVEQQKQLDDAVVTVGIADFPYDRFYQTGWGKVETLQDLDTVRHNSARTWLVYTMPLHTAAAYPAIFAAIKKDFTVVKEFYGTLNGGTVVVCLASG